MLRRLPDDYPLTKIKEFEQNEAKLQKSLSEMTKLRDRALKGYNQLLKDIELLRDEIESSKEELEGIKKGMLKK